MASLYQRPASFRSWNGDSKKSKWLSRDVVGKISVENQGAVRSEFTDAYVLRNDTQSVAIPAGHQYKLCLKNLSLFGLLVTVQNKASIMSRVGIELRDDLDRTLFVFRKKDELTAMPWSWQLGHGNPLVLPSKLSKRFLVITSTTQDMRLDYQPLYFAKGATPFSLGLQPLLIRLTEQFAWFIEDGHRDKIVAIGDFED